MNDGPYNAEFLYKGDVFLPISVVKFIIGGGHDKSGPMCFVQIKALSDRMLLFDDWI